MSVNKVPKPYLGMWRRTLLEQANVIDTTTFVLVIQTEQYHADMRIPDARPDFSHTDQLEDCTLEQLYWLATQQGFTGITHIEGNTCQWIRDHDFQPSNDQRDIGEMTFESDDIVIETGVDADYREIWERVTDSQIKLSVHQINGTDRHGNKTPARLLTANHSFAYVRPRSVVLPKANSMLEAIESNKPNKDLLLDWLDFEISFGEIIDPHHGQIKHSTFPFKEGEVMHLS
jgi:hypothetical protein